MKKIYKNSIKNLMLVILVLASLLVNVCAADASDWNEVYTENYAGESNAPVTSGVTNAGYSYSAEIKDEALVIKSDSVCYYRVQDSAISSLNSKANSHGLSVVILNSSWICTETEDTGDGVIYAAQNTNAILVKEKSGLNALGSVWFKRASGNKRNNIMLKVDSSLFKSTDNNLTMKVKYYTPDGKDPIQLVYPKTNNTNGTYNIYNGDGTITTNTWHTATINLTDIDLTKNADKNTSYSFRFASPEDVAEYGSEFYIHSVEIYKTEGSVVDESAANTVLEQKISDAPIYGNAKLTYDLTLPSDVVLVSGCKDGDSCVEGNYNVGKNTMSVNFADSSKVDFASLQYDIDGDNAKIYALSTDDGGDTQKNLLYQADIADKTLAYTITFDMKAATYTIEIAEDGTPLTLENEGPFDIYNKNEFDSYCTAQYFNIKHNQTSNALLSVVDNISVYSQADPDYVAAASDADAIVIESVITDDFTLPDTGSLNSSAITWTSDDPAVAVAGNTAIVTRGAADIEVVLTATVVHNGIESMKVEKDFVVTVKSLEGIHMEVADCSGRIEADGTITAAAKVIHPGTTGSTSVTFAVFSVDSATGKICNRHYETKAVVSEYGELAFTPVTGMDKNGGNSVKCYLWDNNNKSLANNNPVVNDFKAESKVKGVGLSWKGYDDNDAVEYYEIYKNGSKFKTVAATGTEMTFLDTEATGGSNSYAVVPVDTNKNQGTKIEDAGKYGKIPMTYYLNILGESEGDINTNGNGITTVIKASGAGYTEYISGGRKIPNSKYLPLLISDNAPKKDLAIEFTCKAPANTKLQFLYNDGVETAGDSYTITESEANSWLVFAVKLSGVELQSNNGKMNNVHFALQALGGDVVISKVEMIELSKYE